jgi:hypothetical protein
MTIYELIQQILTTGVEIRIQITKLERPAPERTPESIWATCADCGWSQSYTSEQSARRGLRSHRQHCAVYQQSISWVGDMSSNAHSSDQE